MIMARVETWFNQDLKEAVKVHYLDGAMFSEDNNGNLIGVNVYSNGSPVNLAGSVIGYCVLSTGASVPVIGAISGNKAYIVIPNTVYAVPGNVNIIIKLVSGNDITTLAAVVTSIIGVGGVAADPSAETIAAWTAQINATLAIIAAGSVMYTQSQSLTNAQKLQARTNMGANTSAVLLSGNDYAIVIP